MRHYNTRARFVREIERGNCPNYHVREINAVKTPVSNPDGRDSNETPLER